jgi:hypothetical protein
VSAWLAVYLVPHHGERLAVTSSPELQTPARAEKDAGDSPLHRSASEQERPAGSRTRRVSRFGYRDGVTETRTCAARAPYSARKCPEPVVGRRGKRYCSRTCQNRDQKERWRDENRRADIGIRLRERHTRALQRIAERRADFEAEFGDYSPASAAVVEQEFAGMAERVKSKLHWRAA